MGRSPMVHILSIYYRYFANGTEEGGKIGSWFCHDMEITRDKHTKLVFWCQVTSPAVLIKMVGNYPPPPRPPYSKSTNARVGFFIRFVITTIGGI